jgi:AcrR family transcriptional regulator
LAEIIGILVEPRIGGPGADAGDAEGLGHSGEGEKVRDTSPSALPVSDPWASLTPTARKILAAAKRILVERGFDGLTLEAIAAEAGVNKASTRYYFGSKDGLIEAIVDEIVLTECAAIAVEVSPDATRDERIESFVENARRIATDVESFGGFFDILPHAVRSEALRKRLVFLYETWYEWNLQWLGLDPDADRPDVRALGQLAAAMLDGIAVQASLHINYNAEPVLEIMKRTLKLALEDLAEQDCCGD